MTGNTNLEEIKRLLDKEDQFEAFNILYDPENANQERVFLLRQIFDLVSKLEKTYV